MPKKQNLSKPPTVAELIAIIEVFNRAHELHLKARGMGEAPAGMANPLFNRLYKAAANAAGALAVATNGVQLATKNAKSAKITEA